MIILIYDDLCALVGSARMPAGDQALFIILVGKGEGGGTGQVMRSYLVQMHEEGLLILSNLPPCSRENSRFALCYELEAPSR